MVKILWEGLLQFLAENKKALHEDLKIAEKETVPGQTRFLEGSNRVLNPCTL